MSVVVRGTGTGAARREGEMRPRTIDLNAGTSPRSWQSASPEQMMPKQLVKKKGEAQLREL